MQRSVNELDVNISGAECSWCVGLPRSMYIGGENCFFAGGVLGKKFCLSGVYGAEGWHIWCWLNHCGVSGVEGCRIW